MTIRHEPPVSMFRAYDEDGTMMGEMEYVPASDGTLTATHTLVFEAYAGQGLAGKLLDALVEYARNNGVKIKPVCSYVVSAFGKYPEKYGDVTKL